MKTYFEKNERITGKYMGTEFMGVITSIRIHTVNTQNEVVFIHFDKPIAIFDNSIRDDVCMEIRPNGDAPRNTPGSQMYPCYIRHIEETPKKAHWFSIMMACIVVIEAQKEYARTHPEMKG